MTRIIRLAAITLLGSLLFSPYATAKGPRAAKVTVADASIETVREGVTLIGTVEAFQSSTVASQTDGRVLRLTARTGDAVPENGALAILDTRRQQIDQQRAQALVDAAKVRAAQAQADLELSKRLLSNQAVSSDEVATRERTVAETQNQLTEAQAEVARLAYLIDQATIRAPFSGTLSEERVQAGEWVPVGGGVARMVDLSTVRVKVWVPEHIVGGITVGDTAQVATEAGMYQGKVHAVIPDGDPKSRSFPVEVRVPNPKGGLMAGMLARVTFGVGPAEAVLTVPTDAVVTRGRASHVWKVVDGQGIKISVTMGRRAGERVEVTPDGPLKAGDAVVTRGNERVRPGQPLAVMP